MRITSSKNSKHTSRPKTSSQLKIIKTSDYRTIMCVTPKQNDLFVTPDAIKDYPVGSISKNLKQIKKIKMNNVNSILNTNSLEEREKIVNNLHYNNEQNKEELPKNLFEKNEQNQEIINFCNGVTKYNYIANLNLKNLGELSSPQSINLNFNNQNNTLITPTLGFKFSNQISSEKQINFKKELNSRKETENETFKKLLETIQILEERLKIKEIKIAKLEKKINSKSESARLDKLNFLINILEEKINKEIINYRINLNENSKKSSRKILNHLDISSKLNEKNNINNISMTNNKLLSNNNSILLSANEYLCGNHIRNSCDINFLSYSDNIISPKNLNFNIINNNELDKVNDKNDFIYSNTCRRPEISLSEMKRRKSIDEINDQIIRDRDSNKIINKNILDEQNTGNRKNSHDEYARQFEKLKSEIIHNIGADKLLKIENQDIDRNNIEKSVNHSKSLDIRKLSKGYPKIQIQNLIVDNKTNSNYQNLMFTLENVIWILNDLKDNILDSKKFTIYVKEKEKQFNHIKKELDLYKQREKQSKKIYENLKSKISDLEFEKTKLTKYSKSDKILKMMEANSDNYFAKQNIDLKRRLEIACLLLVKKKEKIKRLNEKVEVLNDQIKVIITSKGYFEDEEKKMMEVLHKKLVYEKIAKGEEKILDFISNENKEINNNNDNFLKNTNKISNKLNYEMSENLEYRIEKLKDDFKETMKDILHTETQEFLKIYQNFDEYEKENILNFIVEQLKSYIRFSQKLNSLIFFFIHSLNYNKDEIMIQLRLKFTEIFESERVTLWAFDDYVNQYHTISDMKKIILDSNEEYFDKISKNGIYKKSKIFKEENKGPQINFNTTINNNSNNYLRGLSAKKINQSIKENEKIYENEKKYSFNESPQKINNLSESLKIGENEINNNKLIDKKGSDDFKSNKILEMSWDKNEGFKDDKTGDDNQLNFDNIKNSIQNIKTLNENEIYPPNIQKIFSQNSPVNSILAIPIKNNTYYGLIEVINSKKGYFSLDDEYLIYIISKYLKTFLYNFNMEEAKQKEHNKDMIPSSIIEIMSRRDFFSLTKSFEIKLNELINSRDTKLILIDNITNEFLYYKHSNNNLIRKAIGGIAGLSLKLNTGILCKYPNHDENYNELIDIQLISNNNCFYSIPLKKENFGVFAIFQFIMMREENTDLHQKKISTHQIEILDYFREMALEIMSNCLQNTINCIDPEYFKKP